MPKPNTVYQSGGLYLVERGGFYHIHGTVHGERVRVSAKTSELRRAKAALDVVLHEMEYGVKADASDRDLDWHTVAKMVCSRHRFHAKARRIPFQVTKHDVYALMKATGFHCAVSGIPFTRQIKKRGDPDPWGPSIDRIESRHGYVAGNIRVVCLSANLAMNRWGYDVLLRLARGVTLNERHVMPEKMAPNLHNDDAKAA